VNDISREVLVVDDLSVEYRSHSGPARVVDHVSFSIGSGEAVSLVGESGSGKSTLALALMSLLSPDSAAVSIGRLVVNGTELIAPSPRDLERFRGVEMAMIFQDPLTSLNPVMTIGKQLMEPLRFHHHLRSRDARARAIELLASVGISNAEGRLGAYPHEFSGGMRQRVVIAMALAVNPRILIADEPTTALDATVQADIVKLIFDLRRETGLAVLWITHDLALMSGFADRTMVMYSGRIIERADTGELFANPMHPYAQALLRSAPTLSLDRSRRLWALEGAPPSTADEIVGCAFRPRCWNATDACMTAPALSSLNESAHEFACWNPRPVSVAEELVGGTRTASEVDDYGH
jgi:oligopeptide/dipeptide ABC transporter ATP-binding protein